MIGAFAGFLIWLLLASAFYTTGSAFAGEWLDIQGLNAAIAVGSFWVFIFAGIMAGD